MISSASVLCAIVTIASAVSPSIRHIRESQPMTSQFAESTAKAESDIRALIAAQAAGWNRHDAKGWATPFQASAEFINILGTPFSGKPAIEEITTRIFNSIFKDSHDSVAVRKIRLVGSELAIVHYEHALTGYAALPPGIQPSEVDADGRGVLRTIM